MTIAPWAVLTIYGVLVVLASLLGGWIPTRVRLTHTRLQTLISFVAGLMLGVALVHLLPHAAAELGNLDVAIGWTLAGLLTMFFLMRAFHVHHHGSAGTTDVDDHAHEPTACEAHGHFHEHAHDHQLSWLGVAVGLSLHTLIDGIAMAAAVAAESHGETSSLLAGFGTFMAVLLHKPLDSLSITTLMTTAGYSVRQRHWVSFGFALMAPVGAALFWFGWDRMTLGSSGVLGAALGMAAGIFLCISLGDLLPEVEYHSHDRLTLSAALLAGVAVAYGVGLVEPAHQHEPHHHEHSVHDHSGHGHAH
jgi:zinc and cadmium transporter